MSEESPHACSHGAASPCQVPSYFDDPRQAKKLHDEALSWIGTPFRPYYQIEIAAALEEAKQQGFDPGPLDVKGPHGGIDCIGLVSEIFSRIGATDKWIFPRSSADYQQHQTGDKVLKWLRGRAVIGDDEVGYSIEPQSEKLANYLQELNVPEIKKQSDIEDLRKKNPNDEDLLRKLDILDRHAVTPRDFFKPGDILVCRTGGLFHMPVIFDNDLHFVNAIPKAGVTEGTIQDSSFSIHLVAIFRLRPRKIPYPGAPA